jgi:hypothetical protein
MLAVPEDFFERAVVQAERYDEVVRGGRHLTSQVFRSGWKQRLIPRKRSEVYDRLNQATNFMLSHVDRQLGFLT